ncbi:MAG: 50S ribosomal protein L11 methyltransferase [Cytophagaceae bacterium]
MDFLEVKIKINPDYAELLMTELVEAGFDSFLESDEGLDAYVEEHVYDKKSLENLILKYKTLSGTDVPFTVSKMEKKNWNEEWEKNFQPVKINDKVYVRASFHQPDNSFPCEIVINPKMSFGTGHHETTSLMLERQSEIDQKNKSVLDAGSGTGILAIYAYKSGASNVVAYDMDDWAYENVQENLELNACKEIKTYKGIISTVPVQDLKFDIVLANINKNVLMKEIPEYTRLIKSGGSLIVSGFYENDIKDIENIAVASGCSLVYKKLKNNWACLHFNK